MRASGSLTLLSVLALILLVSPGLTSALTDAFYYSNATGTVRSPSVTLQVGTAGTSSVSSVEANAATAKVTAGLNYYETATMPVSCGSPTVVSSLTPPVGTGSFAITSGQTACLWTTSYASSTPVPSGTTALDLWASSAISAPTDQTTGSSGGTSNTPTCAYGTNPTQNYLLVVAFLVAPDTITVAAPTDTLANTFSQTAVKDQAGATSQSFEVYVYTAVETAASGADTITLHFTGTVTDSYVTCFEVAGATSAGATTQTGSGQYTSGTSTTTSTASLTPAANDLIYEFSAYQPCGASAPPTYTVGFTAMTARGTDFTGGTNCRSGGAVKYRFNAEDEYEIPLTGTATTGSIITGTWASSITTGTWGWAQVAIDFKPASTTLSVTAYTTTSTGTHQNTLVSSGTTGTINSVKSEILSTFSSSAGTVPAGGYIELTVTASAPVNIYWGPGQLTSLQTPGLFNYVLKVHNAVASSWTINLLAVTSSNVNIGRLSNLTVSFVSPYSKQIIVTGGLMGTSSGPTVTLPASTDINIEIGAIASSVSTSTLVLSMKIVSSASAAYSQYTIDVEVD